MRIFIFLLLAGCSPSPEATRAKECLVTVGYRPAQHPEIVPGDEQLWGSWNEFAGPIRTDFSDAHDADGTLWRSLVLELGAGRHQLAIRAKGAAEESWLLDEVHAQSSFITDPLNETARGAASR